LASSGGGGLARRPRESDTTGWTWRPHGTRGAQTSSTTYEGLKTSERPSPGFLRAARARAAHCGRSRQPRSGLPPKSAEIYFEMMPERRQKPDRGRLDPEQHNRKGAAERSGAASPVQQGFTGLLPYPNASRPSHSMDRTTASPTFSTAPTHDNRREPLESAQIEPLTGAHQATFTSPSQVLRGRPVPSTSTGTIQSPSNRVRVVSAPACCTEACTTRTRHDMHTSHAHTRPRPLRGRESPPTAARIESISYPMLWCTMLATLAMQRRLPTFSNGMDRGAHVTRDGSCLPSYTVLMRAPYSPLERWLNGHCNTLPPSTLDTIRRAGGTYRHGQRDALLPPWIRENRTTTNRTARERATRAQKLGSWEHASLGE